MKDILFDMFVSGTEKIFTVSFFSVWCALYSVSPVSLTLVLIILQVVVVSIRFTNKMQ